MIQRFANITENRGWGTVTYSDEIKEIIRGAGADTVVLYRVERGQPVLKQHIPKLVSAGATVIVTGPYVSRATTYLAVESVRLGARDFWCEGEIEPFIESRLDDILAGKDLYTKFEPQFDGPPKIFVATSFELGIRTTMEEAVGAAFPDCKVVWGDDSLNMGKGIGSKLIEAIHPSGLFIANIAEGVWRGVEKGAILGLRTFLTNGTKMSKDDREKSRHELSKQLNDSEIKPIWNPNVFLEIGIAMACPETKILIVRPSSDTSPPPVDIHAYQYFTYHGPVHLSLSLHSGLWKEIRTNAGRGAS